MPAASLVIDLDARLATFEANLRKSVSAVESAAGQMQGKFAGVTSALTALGAAVSLGAIASWAKEVVTSAAALDDMSEKTGAAVEKLSELQQVARIGGQDFGAVTDLLVKMSRALAGSGRDDETKGVGAALSRLGLSADELRSKDPAEALRLIAVELNKYEDSGGKAALVSALLGKNAAALLPFLKDLATTQGITAKVTAEQAAEAEILEKSLKRLGVESENAKRAFLLDMVPALNEVMVAVKQAYGESGKLAAAWAALGGLGSMLFLGSERSQTLDQLKGVNEQLAIAKRQLESGTLSPSGANKSMFSFLVPDVKLNEQGLAAIRKTVSDLEKEKTRLEAVLTPPKETPEKKGSLNDWSVADKTKGAAPTPKIEGVIDSLEKELIKTVDLGRANEVLKEIQLGLYGAVTPQQLARVSALAKEVDANKALQKSESERARVEQEGREARAAFAKFADDELKKQKDAAEALRKEFVELVDPVQKYRDQLAKLDEALAKGAISADVWAAAQLKIDDSIQAALGMNKELAKTKDIGEELFQKLSSGFEDAIVNGKKFGDVMRGIGQDLLKIFVREQITNPLAGAFKSSIAGGGIGAIGSAAGSALGSAFDWVKGLFGFAQGGQFTVGGSGGTDSQLVAFRATPGEQVAIRTPAQQSAGGGVTVVQNLSFGSDVNQSTLAAWAQVIKQQTISAVAETRQRGGAYSSALGR